MILFIFEGNRREPIVFDAIERIYFGKGTDRLVCSYPATKDAISQDILFQAQLAKFVSKPSCMVSVLCAFPIFIYDYFK